jgi:guanylate kinase
MGQLFVFSAPSGTGKTTIVDNVRQTLPNVSYSVSHTTRRPRKDEQNGVHYHFVDKDIFQGMIDAGDFVEWAEVYGNYYGTSYKSLDDQTTQGLDVLLDLDPQGAKNIKLHYADSILIFVLPPSLDVLEKRLKGRGSEDEESFDIRFRQAITDIESAESYDFIIVNEDLERAILQARSIIISERCRAARQAKLAKVLFGHSG